MKDEVHRLKASCADAMNNLATQRDENLHAHSCATAAAAQGMAKTVILNVKLQGLEQECKSLKVLRQTHDAALTVVQSDLDQAQKALEQQQGVEYVTCMRSHALKFAKTASVLVDHPAIQMPRSSVSSRLGSFAIAVTNATVWCLELSHRTAAQVIAGRSCVLRSMICNPLQPSQLSSTGLHYVTSKCCLTKRSHRTCV
jgi:hypothetical protein